MLRQMIHFYYASGTAWVPDHKFKSILVSGQDSIVADNPEDNLTFVNGNGIAITTDAATDTITFTIVDSEIDHGTISGLDGDDHTQYYNTARHTKVLHDALAIDHGSLSGRGDDDHTQYALLVGRAGGQTLIGGTASGNDLTLQSSSDGTKGNIYLGAAQTSYFDETTENLIITGDIGLTGTKSSKKVGLMIRSN